MTYLVTGATGFIGTKLVHALLARGDAVYYLARRRSGKLPSQASFHSWDTARQPELNALSRIDGIFHLAGEPIAQRWSASVKKRIYDSRVQGTKNLVAALAGLQHRPGVLVSASAIGYYGDRGDEVLAETSAPQTDFLARLCQDWEQAAAGALGFGVRTVSIRIAPVLGREGGVLPAMLTPFRLGVGGRLGDGKQWMSWIHVDDLIRLLLFVADTASVENAANGSSPQPVTNVDFTKALASALHRPALLSIPKFAMQWVQGELAGYLFKSQRVIPKAALEADFRFDYPDLKSALQNLV